VLIIFISFHFLTNCVCVFLLEMSSISSKAYQTIPFSYSWLYSLLDYKLFWSKLVVYPSVAIRMDSMQRIGEYPLLLDRVLFWWGSYSNSSVKTNVCKLEQKELILWIILLVYSPSKEIEVMDLPCLVAILLFSVPSSITELGYQLSAQNHKFNYPSVSYFPLKQPAW